jgi:hypothetical protein
MKAARYPNSRYYGFPIYQKVLERGTRRVFSVFNFILAVAVAMIAAPVILQLLGVV